MSNVWKADNLLMLTGARPEEKMGFGKSEYGATKKQPGNLETISPAQGTRKNFPVANNILQNLSEKFSSVFLPNIFCVIHHRLSGKIFVVCIFFR